MEMEMKILYAGGLPSTDPWWAPIPRIWIRPWTWWPDSNFGIWHGGCRHQSAAGLTCYKSQDSLYRRSFRRYSEVSRRHILPVPCALNKQGSCSNSRNYYTDAGSTAEAALMHGPGNIVSSFIADRSLLTRPLLLSHNVYTIHSSSA